MRRSREDTAETRKKIVMAASRLFRARGIAAVSVADIMGSLGMTVGGFYRHFESKEALVAEAIEAASLETTGRHEKAAAEMNAGGRAAMLLERYLSNVHRAHPDQGCSVAALCSEVGHEGRATKEAFTCALRRLIAMVDEHLPKGERERRKNVLQTAAAMVGAVVLARATSDDALANELFQAVRERALGGGPRPHHGGKQRRGTA